MERHRQAIARLAEALTRRGDLDAVAATFEDEAVVERFGWGERRGERLEVVQGRGDVATWLARTPAGVVFRVEGEVRVEPHPDGPMAEARYRYAAPGISNGGTWRFRLGATGLLVWLAHHPDELDAARLETLDWAGDPAEPTPHAH